MLNSAVIMSLPFGSTVVCCYNSTSVSIANKVYKANVCMCVNYFFFYCTFNNSGSKGFSVTCLSFRYNLDFLKIYSLTISSCV